MHDFTDTCYKYHMCFDRQLSEAIRQITDTCNSGLNVNTSKREPFMLNQSATIIKSGVRGLDPPMSVIMDLQCITCYLIIITALSHFI